MREAAQASRIVSAIGCMFCDPSREGPPATAFEFVRMRARFVKFGNTQDVGQF